MSISSASTSAQVRAAYLDNVGYETANSAGMAKAFIEACRALLMMMAQQTMNQGASTTFSPGLIKGELEAARLWLSQNPDDTANPQTGGGSRFYSFENFRDDRRHRNGGCG